MKASLRPWLLSDAEGIAAMLNSKKVQDNLRDGIPFPYTKQDGLEFIRGMQSAEQGSTFAYAIIAGDKVAETLARFARPTFTLRPPRWAIALAKNTGGKAYAQKLSGSRASTSLRTPASCAFMPSHLHTMPLPAACLKKQDLGMRGRSEATQSKTAKPLA
jgi:hypothetical protein